MRFALKNISDSTSQTSTSTHLSLFIKIWPRPFCIGPPRKFKKSKCQQVEKYKKSTEWNQKVPWVKSKSQNGNKKKFLRTNVVRGGGSKLIALVYQYHVFLNTPSPDLGFRLIEEVIPSIFFCYHFTKEMPILKNEKFALIYGVI